MVFVLEVLPQVACYLVSQTPAYAPAPLGKSSRKHFFDLCNLRLVSKEFKRAWDAEVPSWVLLSFLKGVVDIPAGRKISGEEALALTKECVTMCSAASIDVEYGFSYKTYDRIRKAKIALMEARNFRRTWENYLSRGGQGDRSIVGRQANNNNPPTGAAAAAAPEKSIVQSMFYSSSVIQPSSAILRYHPSKPIVDGAFELPFLSDFSSSRDTKVLSAEDLRNLRNVMREVSFFSSRENSCFARHSIQFLLTPLLPPFLFLARGRSFFSRQCLSAAKVSITRSTASLGYT